jgi:hypothetical protein
VTAQAPPEPAAKLPKELQIHKSSHLGVCSLLLSLHLLSQGLPSVGVPRGGELVRVVHVGALHGLMRLLQQAGRRQCDTLNVCQRRLPGLCIRTQDGDRGCPAQTVAAVPSSRLPPAALNALQPWTPPHPGRPKHWHCRCLLHHPRACLHRSLGDLGLRQAGLFTDGVIRHGAKAVTSLLTARKNRD